MFLKILSGVIVAKLTAEKIASLGQQSIPALSCQTAEFNNNRSLLFDKNIMLQRVLLLDTEYKLSKILGVESNESGRAKQRE